MKIQIPAFSSRSGGQMPDLRLHTDPRARVFDVNRGNKAERTWTKKRDTTSFPDDALSPHPLHHRLSSRLSDVVSFAVTTKLYWHALLRALSRAFPSIHGE